MKTLQFILGLALGFGCFSCKDQYSNDVTCIRYREGIVYVALREGERSKDFFAFVNDNHLGIEVMIANQYESSLPTDSIDFVINYLNSKNYITLTGWKAYKGGTVRLVDQAKVVVYMCPLWGMTETNQRDWFETMSVLKLSDEGSLMGATLNVPVGEEQKWILIMELYGVKQANVDCYDNVVIN